MAEPAVLSLHRMKKIFDNALVQVFVSSIRNRGLMYTNDLAKALSP